MSTLTPLRALILDTIAPRPTPRLPASLRVGRVIEIGPAYRMAEHPPYAGHGRLYVDEMTGVRGRVVDVCPNGDVEIESLTGRGWAGWVHPARVRTIRYSDGAVLPSLDEREIPVSRGGVAR